MRRQDWYIAIVGLFCLLVSGVGFATGNECISEDDEAYTLYVYADSDARVLLDQKCETATGESQLDKTLVRAECRCYDTKVSEVLSRLISSGGPVAVTTRKVAGVYSGLTCRAALDKCSTACKETAKVAPKACSTIQTAGVSAY